MALFVLALFVLALFAPVLSGTKGNERSGVAIDEAEAGAGGIDREESIDFRSSLEGSTVEEGLDACSDQSSAKRFVPRANIVTPQR